MCGTVPVPAPAVVKGTERAHQQSILLSTTKKQSLLWTIFLLSSTGALHHTKKQLYKVSAISVDNRGPFNCGAIKVGDLYAVDLPDVSSLSAEIHNMV